MKNSILIIFLLMSSFLVYSQEISEDSIKVITMNNGDIRIGQILNDDGREILLLTKDVGKIYLRKENIRSIEPFRAENYQEKDGELRGVGPFSTRYYFTTNSLPIKKGENYAMVHLYGPEVHFTVSNRLSIGVMSTWMASPFVVATKFTIPTRNPKLNFGLGTLLGTSGYLNTFRGYGGLHWGMVTLGDRMNNITLSAGFSYVKTGIKRYDSNYVPGTYPAYSDAWGTYFASPPTVTSGYTMNPTGTATVVGIGGIAKVGKKASFIFDAMLFFAKQKRTNNQEYSNVYDPITGAPSYTYVGPIEETVENSVIAFIMPGMRFQTKENRAFQVALAGMLIANKNEDLQAYPIPMVSWFFKF
jgi:hypothetical protein